MLAEASPVLRPMSLSTAGAVRITRNGYLVLRWDVVRRFNGHKRVRVIDVERSDRSDRFGLTVGPNLPGEKTLLLTNMSGGTKVVSLRGVLLALGKARPETVIELPHVWDDDLLVINVSMLPRSEADCGR